jgi:MFS family permease
MSTDSGEKPIASIWFRLIGRRRPLWITLGIGLLLILAPLIAAYLDGLLDDLFSQGHWRLMLGPGVVIAYILVVAPFVEQAKAGVVDAFRPLVLIDDDSFDRLVVEASRVNPIGEGVAFGLGVVLGVWIGQSWLLDPDAFWLKLVVIPSVGLMFGLLVWTIYVALASTRLNAELHRQPLRVDIFDTKPFWPVGRQSLIIALVFVGGIVLGMLSSLVGESILDWRNWLLYSLLALVAILIFFLNMRPTHRVLAAEKKKVLGAVEGRILLACRALMARLDAEESTGTLGAEINALVAYEKRIEETSTWPYDTAMLRTLFFSVIFPAVAALARIVGEFLVG